jgi:hypothetical protein
MRRCARSPPGPAPIRRGAPQCGGASAVQHASNASTRRARASARLARRCSRTRFVSSAWTSRSRSRQRWRPSSTALLTIVVRHQTIRLGDEAPLRAEVEASATDLSHDYRRAAAARQLGVCPSIDLGVAARARTDLTQWPHCGRSLASGCSSSHSRVIIERGAPDGVHLRRGCKPLTRSTAVVPDAESRATRTLTRIAPAECAAPPPSP